MSQNNIPCVFIDTESGIPIYNLETAEYWIKDDVNGEQLIQLKYIDDSANPRIYISGEYIKPLSQNVSKSWEHFIKHLLYMLYSKDSKIVTNMQEYFSGTNIYDFEINEQYISKRNNLELDIILWNIMLGDKNYYRINKMNVYPLPFNHKNKIYSFNFVKQLKRIALSLEYNLNFECNYYYNEIYWTIDKLVKSNLNKNECSDKDDFDKFYTKTPNTTNIYLGQYHTITNIIKNIKDDKFNSVDLNTGNK